MSDPSPSTTESQSLVSFTLLVAACVLWVTIVVILLPRLLGRLLAFLANRASRNAFHIQIPTIHLYPLAGRVVAHSIRYTVPDGTCSVEELVLQIRWWRKAPKGTLRHLSVDDAHTLDPLAVETHELDRENTAWVLKRVLYRIRRWWRRTALVRDPVTAEPPPMISLIAVGMRVRLVNLKANYEHVNRVLELAKGAKGAEKSFDVPLGNIAGGEGGGGAETSEELSSSDDAENGKPFKQRVFELLSLRITSGAFYICDMGESPLVRANISTAKVRYRYGAPACALDKSRKKFVVRLIGLRVSVADCDTLSSIVNPGAVREKEEVMVDNTDRMIKRVIALGHRGILDPHLPVKRSSRKKRPRGRGRSPEKEFSFRERERQTSFRYRNRQEAREARKKQVLPCKEILFAETAIVDYVFDEPGPYQLSQRGSKSRLEQAIESSSEGNTEDPASFPPPVCKVLVVLRGAMFSYDTRAVADVERVMERLQPAFYDLMPLATKVQSLDGRRSASGIQIEIKATPLDYSPSREDDLGNSALVTIPFDARQATWKTLSSLNVRRWPRRGGDGAAKVNVKEQSLPPSCLYIHAKHLSVRTEIPYKAGVQQETVVTAEDVDAKAKGVVDMPVCRAQSVTIVRLLHLPQIWNDVHVSSVDILVRDSETTFVPDTLRVIDDIGAFFRENTKKPQDVRYFVPFRESIRIRADGKYKIILACSHDNAWEEIDNGCADDYGTLRVSGETGELVLSQSKPTEFLPDSITSSWTLSLPNAVGRLEIPLPHAPLTNDATGVHISPPRPSDSDRSMHHKHRPVSLAQRVRTQLSSLHHHVRETNYKPHFQTVTMKVFQMGKICSVTGKVSVNEERIYLNSAEPLFLDSSDKSDISFKTSSVVFDYNPHHVSNFLNMARNYAGTGNHSLSTVERDRLHQKRKELAASVLDERRHPSPKECIILGLGAGQTQASVGNRKAMDELLRMTFQIDVLVIRLHDLPHALSPFSETNKNICSLKSSKFFGSLKSNRMGLELRCGPETERTHLTLQGGYQEFREDSQSVPNASTSGNLPLPVTTIENFEVRKRSTASPDWGSHFSELAIVIGNVHGCILDLSTVCLSRIAMASIPHHLFEDQAASSALFAVDNVDVQLERADLLVLSTSSDASAERSGQMSRLSLLRNTSSKNRISMLSQVPCFLTGVTHFRAPLGLRFCMSSRASECLASHSRLFIPDISVDVLMSWGGKLTPWVDDATLRVQVSHAVLVRGEDPQGSFQDGGLLRRAAEMREITLELVWDSRPRLWSQTVAVLQQRHISDQREKTRGEIPSWSLPMSSFAEEYGGLLEPVDELEQAWWLFLQRGRRAAILSRHEAQNSGRSFGKIDSMSLVIVSNAVVVVSPESLELANDIVLRSKEDVSSNEFDPKEKVPVPAVNIPERLFSSDIREMWCIYEASRPPVPTVRGQTMSSVSHRALETKGLKIVLLSPLLPGENRHSDPLLPAESADDAVEVTFPFGIHLLEQSKTDTPSLPGVTNIQKRLLKATILHTRMFHLSIPDIIFGSNGYDFCLLRGIIIILQDKIRISGDNGEGLKSVQAVRDDKHSVVSRIESVAIGKKHSGLEVYACFGRIASIFLLMTRALALENASVLSAKTARVEKLCSHLLGTSMTELIAMRPGHVRTFFTEASKQCAFSERSQGGEFKGVPFSDVIPRFAKEEAVAADEPIQSGIVTSLDFALRTISLTLGKQNIVTTDSLSCKGGYTARTHESAALDGHVLNASVGKISLSIRDDIAANTLRMVSDVAKFVRRATFSMPMLRYDADLSSKPEVKSSELLSFSYMNGEYLKANVVASLEQSRPSQGLKDRVFPPTSHGSHMIPRAHWYSKRSTRLRAPRAGITTAHLSSLGANAWNTRISRDNRDTIPMLSSISRTTKAVLNDLDIRSDQGATEKIIPLAGTAQAKQSIDKRRYRPQSSNDVDQRLIWRRRIPHTEELFQEDDQYYAYVAVPTAVDIGPPRKRAKSRVRVLPVVPPAFSDVEKFSTRPKAIEDVVSTLHQNQEPRLQNPEPIVFGRGEFIRPNSPRETVQSSHSASRDSLPVPTSSEPLVPKMLPAMTVFVSCREILCQYFRRKSHPAESSEEERKADLRLSIEQPRLTFMSCPSKGSHSVVVTASSARLKSASDDDCILTGSINNMGVKMSIAQSFVPSTLPKVIASARISELNTTLHATDLKSVLRFRENFKLDLMAVVSAFVRTKSSISEMARATRLSSSKILYPGRSLFSTMSFDLLLENSRVRLQGFHLKDSEMCMSYLLDGLFFSIVASEDDSAALTLGIRLYGHGLSLSAPSWPADEVFHFPSLDARGVQWGESTGLPTLLKVSAEPLLNCTSIKGLRHVLFTVAGLMAFQNTMETADDLAEQTLPPSLGAGDLQDFYADGPQPSYATGATPFSRSFAAWARTKGVRMDLSIRPMSISLVSGQVVALFQLGSITGIFEWNKLVTSGVQLHTAVSIPKISLMFMRMPLSEFAIEEIQPNEQRASMSIAFEKSRIDVLKIQDDLTHTFTFRVDIFAVSGQLRPWRFVLDAAVWADEQELVSDLQSINYVSSSTPKPRTPWTPRAAELTNPLEHRIVLVGANVQRFKLAVPLLNSEEYATSRLALRATELHILARKRFDNLSTPQRNILEVKSHFIGILWENNALFSSHHARVTLGMGHPARESTALFGALNIVMVAGTWRICPRKDVVLAVLEAKNGRDNKSATEKTRDLFGSLPDVLSKGSASIAGDTSSNTTEKRGRLLMESLRFKMLRSSGAIEGLDGDGLFHDTGTGASASTRSTVMTSQASKLTLPAFSVAMVREAAENFDLIDIDFSGREGGEFPPKCLQKVSNLLNDLFGAVASDRQVHSESMPTVSPPREVSRNVSILIRYGKSMYKAQEDLGSPVESKFSFFAGRSSTILVSLRTEPVFGEECSHTTVMTGISPKLALEITPLIEGSMAQSLRLIDARFLHGVNPCYPPQSLFHVSKVTALLDAKTLLLTQGRLNLQTTADRTAVTLKSCEIDQNPFAVDVSPPERNVMVVLGRSLKSSKGSPNQKDSGSPSRFEPDIRLQLKLPLSNEESDANQVDVAVERLHVGFCQVRSDPFTHEVPLNVHIALHEANLRGLWDILSCRLRLQENIFSCNTSGVSPKESGTLVITNILNRLHFESRQYENHTMKLAIDALATILSVPKRDILVESTTIRTEISHTMAKSIVRISSQFKKLHSEVKLLLEREMSRESKRNNLPKRYSQHGRSADSLLMDPPVQRRRERKPEPGHGRSMTLDASNALSIAPTKDELLRRTEKRTRVYIKGDELSALMRGYQFDESQHSAVISLSEYDLNYEYDSSRTPEPIHIRQLGVDFSFMKMTYNDDERAIHSDLFKVPTPKLRLKVIDTDGGLAVELLGDLELKLGPGFYYWQDFKKLSELTIRGITPAQDTETILPEAAPPDRPEIWDGRVAQVSVRLNPRIDVIGDLTADMLQFAAARQGHVDIVPKHLYDFVAIPIETLSEVICDSLLR